MSNGQWATDLETVRVFHEQTKHGGQHDRSRLRAFRPLDPANRPEAFKRYPGVQTLPLPTDLGESSLSAGEVLSGGASSLARSLELDLLARLLFFSAGVTRQATRAQSYFRTAMSAGNLHPIEVYVVNGDVAGLAAGVHHFAPLEFGLTTLRVGDYRPVLADAAADPDLAAVPALLVLTGIPWRTGWKYGERGFRHLYWDAGTMLANTLSVGDGAGIPARVRLAFADRLVSRLLGLDGVEEFPLALVAVGRAGESSSAADVVSVPPLQLEVAPLSANPLEFPLVTETQSAGQLDSSDVASWRERAAALLSEAASASIAPANRLERQSIESLILRRGSTRLMRREPVREEALGWAMAAASRPVSGDFTAADGSLLEHYLSVHAVEGVTSGTYRWKARQLVRLRSGDFRGQAQQLCLDQPLGGDSAYTVFHCTDLGHVLDALGARGYRAAHLEAGIAAGRLQLAAFALGLGGTGLTFFDDAVSGFFATRAACLLVTSVGVPEYRSRPGGLPRQPAELRSFDDLMVRLGDRLRTKSWFAGQWLDDPPLSA